MQTRSIKTLLALVVYGALIGIALAQSIGGMEGIGPRIGGAGGNGGGGGGCSNSLDLSQTCNSANGVAVGIM